MFSNAIKLIVAALIIVGVIIFSSFRLHGLFENALPKTKVKSNKGIYITANVAHNPKLFNNIKAQAKAVGIDTLVIDGKADISPPLLALLKEKKLTRDTKLTPNPWLAKLTEELHKEGFIVTVRLVVFKDDRLALARPDLAVHLAGNRLYSDLKGGLWADPHSNEVHLYNALIAETAALSGVDEIQFDYIRFPAEAGSQNARYPAKKKGLGRVYSICAFLDNVRTRTQKYNVSLAVDIFGVTAWQSQVDTENLGQDLKRMAEYLDVISPMLYPSHFHNGYDGFANPGSAPYYFINTGVKKAWEILSGEATVVVPWIQGFNLRSPNYGPNYINEQIRGAKEAGSTRFIIWNARNDYSVSFRALSKK